MPSIADIRKEWGPDYAGMSDYAIVDHLASINGADPKIMAQVLGVKPKNDPGFYTSMKGGLASYPYGAGRILADAVPGMEDNALLRYGQNAMERNPSSEASSSWEGFKESPWQGAKEFVGGGIGSSIPAAIPYIGAGVRGAALAGESVSLLGRAAAVGRGLGAQTVIAGVPSYGQNRLEQDQEGVNDPLRAAVAATGQGMIESKLGFQRILGEAGSQTQRQLVKDFAASPLKTAGKTVAKVGFEESLEEGGQQPLQQWAAHKDPTTGEALRDTGWSMFGGAVGSLGLGAFAGARMGLGHRNIRNELKRDQYIAPDASTPTDLLAGLENRDYDRYTQPARAEAEQFQQFRDNPLAAAPGATMGTMGDEQIQAEINAGQRPDAPSSKQHAARQREYDKMFNAPSGVFVNDPATGQERSLTVGEWHTFLDEKSRGVTVTDNNVPITTPGEATSILKKAHDDQAAGMAVAVGTPAHAKLMEAQAFLTANGYRFDPKNFDVTKPVKISKAQVKAERKAAAAGENTRRALAELQVLEASGVIGPAATDTRHAKYLQQIKDQKFGLVNNSIAKHRAEIAAKQKEDLLTQGAINGNDSQSVHAGGPPANQAEDATREQAPSGGVETAPAVPTTQAQEVTPAAPAEAAVPIVDESSADGLVFLTHKKAKTEAAKLGRNSTFKYTPVARADGKWTLTQVEKTPAQVANAERISKANKKARQLDTEKDSLVVATAKLGGIANSDRETMGFDPENTKGANYKNPRHGDLFSNKGVGVDNMLSMLEDAGYITPGTTAAELGEMLAADLGQPAEKHTHWNLGSTKHLEREQEQRNEKDRQREEDAKEAAKTAIQEADLSPDDAVELTDEQKAAEALDTQATTEDPIAKANRELAELKAKLADVVDEFVDRVTPGTRLEMTPMEERRVLPILTEMISVAFSIGKLEMKIAIMHLKQQLGTGGDIFPMSTYIKAYNDAVSGVKAAKGTTKDMFTGEDTVKKAVKAMNHVAVAKEEVPPEDIDNEVHREAVEMYLAGEKLRGIANTLTVPADTNPDLFGQVGGNKPTKTASHVTWNNILASYGYSYEKRLAKELSEVVSGQPSPVDSWNQQNVGESLTPDEFTPEMGSATDEVVDHSLENNGITNRGSMDSGGAVRATDDRQTVKEARRFVAAQTEETVKDVTEQLRALHRVYKEFSDVQKRVLFMHAQQGALTTGDIAEVDQLIARQQESKIAAQRKAEADNERRAKAAKDVQDKLPAVMEGNLDSAHDVAVLFAYNPDIAKYMWENYGSPRTALHPSGRLDPELLVNYIMGHTKSQQKNAAMETTTSRAMPLTPKEVAEEAFSVVTDEQIANSKQVAANAEATLDIVLDAKDKARIIKEAGLQKTFGPETKRWFLNKYANWLHKGGMVWDEMQDLFKKVLKSTVNGILAISLAFNFTATNPIPDAHASVPVTKFSVTQTINHPTADFSGAEAPLGVKMVADWQVRTNAGKRDTHKKPFIVADKAGGLIYAFGKDGKLIAKAPALFGQTAGDKVVAPEKSLDDFKKSDKVTPAGAFSGAYAADKDYGNVLKFASFDKFFLAIHRVYLGNPAEKRIDRLNSTTGIDNRISYGCINVTNEFFDGVISKHFAGDSTVVVMPDTGTLEEHLPGINEGLTKQVEMTVGGKQSSATNVSWGSDKYGRNEKRSTRGPMASVRRNGGKDLETGNNVRHKDGRVGRVLAARYRESDNMSSITVKFSDGKTESVTPDTLTKIRDASVSFDGRTGHFGNESVHGGLRKITADDDIALEFGDRVGAVMVTGIDRVHDGVKGRASDALKSLTRWADNTNNTLVLMPSASGDLKQGDLKAWYSRNGFVSAPDGAMVRKTEKQGVLFSKGESTKGSTIAELTSLLKGYFHNPAFFDRRVEVVQSSKDLPAAVRNDPEFDDSVKAVVHAGKAYIVADKVPANEALSILLHEVGVHLGMKKLLGGNYNYMRLIDQLKKWESKPGSQEHDLVKKARERVNAAGTSALDQDHELVAYFVEEAVNAGINPTDLAKAKGPIAEWVESLMKTVMAALKSLGMNNLDKLTAQNIVDLAYGAARVQLSSHVQAHALPSTKGNNLYSYGGVNAKQSNKVKSSYTQAVLMAANGEDMKDIYDATGWFEADDGKWRFEIDDKGMKFSPKGIDAIIVAFNDDKPIPLGELIAHKKLFAAYPDLATSVTVGVDVDLEEENAWMSADGKAILISPYDIQGATDDAGRLRLLATLSHEIQHVIQRREGFAGGGNMENPVQLVGNKAHAETLLRVLEKYVDVNATKFSPLVGAMRGIIKNFDANKTLVKDYLASGVYTDTSALDFLRKLFNKPRGGGGTLFRLYADLMYERYRLLMGETEARDVSLRKTYGNPLGVYPDLLIKRGELVPATTEFPTLKFSKGVRATASRIAGAPGAQVVDDVKHTLKKFAASFASLHDLVKEYTDKLPSLKNWYDAVQKSIATRHQYEQAAEAIAAAMDNVKVNPTKVNEFISKSTYDQKWGYDPKFAHRQVTVDPAMAAEWNKLNPQEQAIVSGVFAHGENMRLAKDALIKKMGLPSILSTGKGSLLGPYAPLKRFGDYIAQLKSAQLVAAEQAEDTKLVAKLKADPQHYVMSMFDTMGQTKKFAEANASKWAMTDAFEKSERIGEIQPMPHQILEKVMSAVRMNKVLPGPAKTAMEKLVQDMWFQSIDEHNARTSGLRRLNRAGYDADMIRSFLSHARAESRFLASMEHGGAINDAYYAMQQEAKDKTTGKRVAQDEFNVIAKHYADQLTYKDTPWQDRAMALTSAWQLSTSLGYHLQNALQGIMVTIPKLAADMNDYTGAWNHFMSGYKTLSDTGMWGNIDLSKVKNTGLRAALQRAADMGVLDVGMEEDLTHFEAMRTGYGVVDKASKGARTALHLLRKVSRAVETANRVSSATAAYNMAKEKGKSEKEAQDYAVNILQTTQGDFSRVGAPLLLKNLPKAMTQYRKYQFMMAALYVKGFRDAFHNADPKVKAAGRRLLAFKLFHTAMAAGVLGMPLMNLAALAFSAMGGDDEPKDLERSLREWIGDEDLANLMLHGAGAYVGLSGKLGEDKIFSIMPYTDWDISSKKGLINTAAGLAGPAASQAMKFADGIGLLEQGELYKGTEKFMPKGVADGMKAFRTANEGFTLKNGDVMFKPDDINGLWLALDSIGLKSTEMQRMEWLRGQQYEIKKFYTDRTSEIEHDYKAALKDGDTDKAGELRQEWQDLQTGKDHLRKYFGDSHDELKRQPLSTLLKYPASAAKREQKLQRASQAR